MISSFLLRHFFVLQAPLADANYHLHGAMDQITPAVPIVAAVDPLPVVPESKFTSEFRYLRQNIGYRKDPPNYRYKELVNVTVMCICLCASLSASDIEFDMLT